MEVHFGCLGMHLARLEMRVLLNVVLDRLPGLRLDPAAEDMHIHGLIFRSAPNLPVRFDPAIRLKALARRRLPSIPACGVGPAGPAGESRWRESPRVSGRRT